jgi:hypothetical protein
VHTLSAPGVPVSLHSISLMLRMSQGLVPVKHRLEHRATASLCVSLGLFLGFLSVTLCFVSRPESLPLICLQFSV